MIARVFFIALFTLIGIGARATEPAERLCDVLGRVGPGEQIPVTLTGIYVVSYEHQLFYNPATPTCAIDVQPVTWLEFSSKFKADRSFDEHVRGEQRVLATLSGVLWGPGEVKADDLSAPMMIAYANRIANRRYGHMNAFRTRFVVESVKDVRRVPNDVPSYGEWAARRWKSDMPRLTSSELPQYPPAAQNVGITGAVIVEVSVGGGAVKTTKVMSGDRILVDAVLTNIATWRFDASVEATFTTTFLFELQRRPTGADRNAQLDLNLPIFARIAAPMNGW